MLGQRDKAHFEEVWRKKDQVQRAYQPGANQRVDEAIKTIAPGGRFLDIGCGAGILAAQLGDRFDEVYGIDIAESAVAFAAQRGVRAQTHDLNADPLPFADGFFDTLAMLSVLQYVYDVAFVLDECGRVLKPGGTLVLAVPNMRTFWRLWKLAVCGRFPRTSLDDVGYDGGTLHYFCHANLVVLLERAGFQISRSCGIFCLPRWVTRLPDNGFGGVIKREFCGGEIFAAASKV